MPIAGPCERSETIRPDLVGRHRPGAKRGNVRVSRAYGGRRINGRLGVPIVRAWNLCAESHAFLARAVHIRPSVRPLQSSNNYLCRLRARASVLRRSGRYGYPRKGRPQNGRQRARMGLESAPSQGCALWKARDASRCRPFHLGIVPATHACAFPYYLACAPSVPKSVRIPGP